MNRRPATASKRAMHPETCKLIKDSIEVVRGDLKTMFARTRLAACVELARAEALIAEYEASAAPLPTNWAHVHEVDCAGVTGIVTRIPGGLRVEWLDIDVPDDATMPAVRRRDIYAISRVDWISAEEYLAHAAMSRSMVADRIKQRLRNSTMPDGYVLVQRTNEAPATRFGIQRADGLVLGYWRGTNEPREAAWEAFDGDHSDGWKPPIDPVVPYTGDLHIPF